VEAEELLTAINDERDLAMLRRINIAIDMKMPRVSIGQMVKDFNGRMIDEMETHVVLLIPASAKKYFEEQQFPSESVAAFPSATEDMIEAGKCFALGRYTACVMHLSRIVEVGLRCIVQELPEVKLKHDWGGQLNEIEKELEKRYKFAGARTPDDLFFSEAASQIGHMKNAWRNPSMHVDRRYNDEVAGDIFNAVKAFMRHLATRLSE
jgi:hypothetical protein